MKKRMTLLDGSFIRMERHESPQHGTAYVIFRLPDGASADYPLRLVEDLRKSPPAGNRFLWVLARGPMDRLSPSWNLVDPSEIDLDYHIEYTTIAPQGGESELREVISRLTAAPLDMSRPPWEAHVIDGLEGGRFALFLKMNHAMIDGVTVLRMLMEWLSPDPSEYGMAPVWAIGVRDQSKGSPETVVTTAHRGIIDRVTTSVKSVIAVTGATRAAIAAARNKRDDGLVAPYAIPKTILNGRITQRRDVSTQIVELARMKRIAKGIDGTLNDAVAVVMGTALRRYLDELGELPERSLVGGILASLRGTVDEATSAKSGNVIGFIFADLATDADDIGDRARRVTRSTLAGKVHLLGLHSNAMNYSALVLAPFIATTISGTGHRLPLFNIALSNIPGAPGPMYWNGAEAESVYASTIIANGRSVVVAIVSWNGKLCFTFTSCPDSAPHPERIAAYLPDAIEQVESAVQGAIRTLDSME